MRMTKVSIAKAAAAVGVSRQTGYRWEDEANGTVRRAPHWEHGGRSLSLGERELVALGLARNESVQTIAAHLGRHRSVIYREIERNSNRDGSYRAVSAHARAWTRALRPKVAKLMAAPELRAYVVAKLKLRWSPQQISARLVVDFPDRAEMRVSHETIYQAVYVQLKGELRKELSEYLRRRHTRRVPQGRVPSSARHIPDKILISQRPAEVEDRAVPGHWEGDLIMGARNRSAIGTLVERTTRYVVLLHLPKVRDVSGVRDAMIAAMRSLPEVMQRSVTWDQGHEMRAHAQITMATDVAVYFCDPHSPWQRGTNENTNGLLRQYFPKGTDLSVYTPEDLQQVQDEFNGRPRQTLRWRTPTEAFTELVASAA
ncbi:IS30 family transposase [Rhodococcus aetherivorans]|jgi:IS30 family transposase|uniref:IS30 family transposase n=3 Tax=Rhodococcus TaxID=1827 RepID=A0AA46SEI7_9NOCA|nr:IS30 family transposase [Rhodococcus aetherivorans]UGQ41705.1 IS30 family transposase [Rhodococcus aetherivorans]UYF91650.1 IS30 family transposase [Rhodococcus aetherivorans]UYF92290.1 IS30 family transposase [Rhodococcus aetherivorans]UYF92581.1 IS30 family transposase [Rhodococcus aetherivorans]UYF93169.1 IS30 family transposase [Rhodococcus aetherivorans]